MVERLRDLGYE